MGGTSVAGDGGIVMVRMPISIRRRGGRKLVLAPDGSNVTTAPICRHIDNAMGKAISSVLRLTPLAPDIVEAIVARRQSARGCSWIA